MCWCMWLQILELSNLDGLLQAANNPNNFTQRLTNPNATLTYFAFTNTALNKPMARGWSQLLVCASALASPRPRK